VSPFLAEFASPTLRPLRALCGGVHLRALAKCMRVIVEMDRLIDDELAAAINLISTIG
jgi:hypothetical protein